VNEHAAESSSIGVLTGPEGGSPRPKPLQFRPRAATLDRWEAVTPGASVKQDGTASAGFADQASSEDLLAP